MQRIAQKKWIFFGCLQKKRYLCTRIRKDAGVVDRAALEMRCTGNCTGGSNPSLSANDKGKRLANKSLFLLKKRESRRRGMRTRRGFVIDEVAFETKGRKNPSLSANDKKERGLQISLFFFISPNVLPTNHTLLYICASFSSV